MTVSSDQFLALVVLAFACYRIATMIAEDIGPCRVFERFRATFPEGWQRQGISCVGCVGVWVSAVATIAVSLVVDVGHPLAIWLAVSGGICFINRLAPCP